MHTMEATESTCITWQVSTCLVSVSESGQANLPKLVTNRSMYVHKDCSSYKVQLMKAGPAIAMPVNGLLQEALHVTPILHNAMPDGPVRASALQNGFLSDAEVCWVCAAAADDSSRPPPGLCSSDGCWDDERGLQVTPGS